MVNETLISWVLQRMSDIHFSTADNSSKMEAARTVMDHMSTRFTEKDTQYKSAAKMLLGRSHHDKLRCKYIAPKFQCLMNPRPRAISGIKQRKLAAREHLRAVLNCLNQLDLDLSTPETILRPIDTSCEMRTHYDNIPFVTDQNTGCSRWDAPCEYMENSHLRLVLGADEGSPLFAAVQFLHSRDVAVRLVRDELQLGPKIRVMQCFVSVCAPDTHFTCKMDGQAQAACILSASTPLQPSHEATIACNKMYSFMFLFTC